MIKFVYPDGATPLDPNETDGLIPSDISIQSQLNEAEQGNNIEAATWAMGRKHRDSLSEPFLRKLHHRMFSLVWRWAGHYRKTDKNLGGPWALIPETIGKLISDTQYWIDHQTYPWDELGARFHYRLVSIHPFPNGNGRHARLMTDILMINFNQKKFSWGQKGKDENFRSDAETRKFYIRSLREADNLSFSNLILFVRS
ncbi:MAG: mobile mystery protein B [Deltaproteobacteria bacterium]|nr:mobile mystery protein B [Deltaproteobacteria bacterium]